MDQSTKKHEIVLSIIIIITALWFGIFATSENVKIRGGLPFLEEGKQLLRHRAILEGHAGNPWQYRVLSAYLIEGAIQLLIKINIPHPIAVSFIMCRVLLGTAICICAFIYYQKLGLSRGLAFNGMLLLGWGMSYAHYDSDLQFNTYFDILFYLLVVLCILHKRLFWLIPLMLLAALNRETSGLIPLLIFFSFRSENYSIGRTRTMCIAAATLGIYLVIFILLRSLYPEQTLLVPYGNHPGYELLTHNITSILTLDRLFATLSIIPIVALIGYRQWPQQLKVFFWVVVPIWFAIHFIGSVVAEARLFLVPQALIFLPGFLFFVGNEHPHININLH